MIIDWNKIAQNIYNDLKAKISNYEKKPTLAVVLVWNDPASLSYINQKKKFADYVWMNFILREFNDGILESDLIWEIESLNSNPEITWFIVQLPLPSHICEQKIIDLISPKKDVDWFTKENIWKLFLGEESWLYSCTPKWIKRLLDEYNIPLKWKNVTIVGKSNIVWKPLSLLFINHCATVTVCDIFTKDLKEHTLKSDIIVSATWVPWLIGQNIVNPWTVVIDVWFNFEWWKIRWDCNFEELEKDNIITPVPWWVGPMTVAMLIENTYLAFIGQKHEK